MAYAADQITVNGVRLEQLETLDIRSEAGAHGELSLCGSLDSDNGEETLYRFTEQDAISVYAGRTLIFSGIITKAGIWGLAETVQIRIEAKSRSILMDRKKKSRSFQDVSLAYSRLVRLILKDYPKSDAMLLFEDRPIGEIAVQYKETDWEFLKRMLSQLHAVLSCRIASDTLQLYGGIPKVSRGKWEYEAKSCRKELGSCRCWLQQGLAVHDTDFFSLEAETGHIPELFEEAEEAGASLVVRGFACSMERGALSWSCRLQRREGILEPAIYPMHLVGAALEGRVLETAGLKIRLHLEIDDGNSLADAYWFPFSTLSASPDGSGWYYMPEKGDRIRVYFPSKFTRDATAVAAVSSYDGKSGGEPDRMGNPSARYLSNPGGQQMKLAEDGVCLSCGGEAGVKIGEDGSVSIESRHTVEISAQNNVSIEAEEAVSIHALENAVISCTKGGAIQMSSDGNLSVQGSEVKVD